MNSKSTKLHPIIPFKTDRGKEAIQNRLHISNKIIKRDTIMILKFLSNPKSMNAEHVLANYLKCYHSVLNVMS